MLVLLQRILTLFKSVLIVIYEPGIANVARSHHLQYIICVLLLPLTKLFIRSTVSIIFYLRLIPVRSTYKLVFNLQA